MKDCDNNTIYVGKAKNLRKRVNSYYQKNEHDPKTQALIRDIDNIEFITTDNEIEALLLENTLIKKHKPKYNINLKDSQRYAYLLITDEAFPRLLSVRDKTQSGKYFGPFVSGFERKEIQLALGKIFKIRTCTKFPKRPCLRHHINLCDAPCVNHISKEDYNKQIQKAESFLRGHTKELINQLNREMKEYCAKLEFEKAIKLRNQMHALKNLQEKQNVERNKKYNEDIINYIIHKDYVYLTLFNVYKGTLTNKLEFVFDYFNGFFENFISQYYSEHNVPKELIVPKKIDELVNEFLNYQRGSNVLITVPKKGAKKKLLELVKLNIEFSFFGNIKKVEALKESLQLEFTPNVIECFDVSHISGTSTVGSMVQFRNGRSIKSNYRRYKIKSYLGNDDFSGIYEIVIRRYKRVKEEDKEFPDLIIIDGGKGQLNAALDSLKRLGLNIPIISIAKHFEEIFVPGRREPILLDNKDMGLQFIKEIRDEAHRFAINYNRLLRAKTYKD